LITTPEALVALAGDLGAAPVVAVDLEADSMYHFREKVCLVQMASAAGSFVIDTLAVADLSVLAPVFSSPRICKVFHGADYDVRSLYRDYGIVIDNLFDTQIAATFLGLAETGLESLVRRYFGVQLDKQFQKKDWSQRPLPDAMVAYAARDVLYLVELADRLRAELDAQGRLAWVLEECALLSQVRPAEADAGPLFLRFKGAGRLDRRSLAVLEALLQLRVTLAARKDRPLFKVFGNASLLQLAQAKPATMEALADSRALSPRQIQIHGSALLGAVQAALNLPESRLPRYPRQTRPSFGPRVAERMQHLRAWRDRRAAALGLDPAVLFSKAQLAAIAQADPRRLRELEALPEIHRWQMAAFGRGVLGVLSRIR
jgi:ribonuclease D